MKLKKIVTVLFIVVAFGFLLGNIFQSWDSIISYKWEFNETYFILFILFLLPLFAINAMSWHLIMRLLGENLSYYRSLRIWVLSNCGRFIPGMIWQYAGRVHLSKSAGVSTSKATFAVMIEALGILSMGFVIFFFTLLFYKLPIRFPIQNPIYYLVGFVVVLSLIFLLFLVRRKVVIKFVEIVKSLFKDKTLLKEINYKYIPILVFSFLLQFVFGGSILFFLVRSITDVSVSFYPLYIGIYAVSWLMGYLTFFAPSGLGVQELSIAGLLSIYLPFSLAGLLAILFRFSLFFSELLIIVFVLIARRLGNLKIFKK